MIQRATVKPNASRAGWLVTSSDLASEPGLSMNGNSPVLRLAPSACPGLTALELAAFSAATSRIPPRHGAVGRTSAPPSTLRISALANLLQLLRRPWRPRNQPKREPAPHDRRRHTGGRGRLTD
jgi:hypothetical protein